MSAIIPYLQPGAITNAQSDITDLQALSGMPDNSLNLGTFTGVTIPDSQTAKQALQALETEVEDRLPNFVQWQRKDGGYKLTSSTYLTSPVSDFGTDDFSVFVDLTWATAPSTTAQLIGKLSGNNRWLLFADAASYKIFFVDNGGSITVANFARVPSVNDKCVGVILDRDGNTTLYINGESSGTTSISALSAVNFGSGNTASIVIGGTSLGMAGSIHSVRLYNRALPASDAAAYSRGEATQFSDRVTSTSAQTSGTLTIGKRYRISSFQAGDDFTNVGAGSNATGVEFVATGTTPTTWTNSSSLILIGAVAEYLPSTASPSIWADASALARNATNNGATLLYSPRLYADEFVLFSNLPTSSAGLATGQVWNDSGTLKIV